jgi:murein DD-endopeptidase MepM/ murein hydrolase activator NlpD
MKYIIPFKRRPVRIGQGFNNNKGSHRDWPEDGADMSYSIDFDLPEGTKIIASRGGTIVAVRVEGKKNYSGENIKKGQVACDKWMNEIGIKHSDGTYADYAHVKYKGAFVKVGDKVKQGQVIGLSGNTGWSSEPHLDFCIFRRNYKNRRIKTIKFKFEDYKGSLENSKIEKKLK